MKAERALEQLLLLKNRNLGDLRVVEMLGCALTKNRQRTGRTVQEVSQLRRRKLHPTSCDRIVVDGETETNLQSPVTIDFRKTVIN